MSEPTPVLPAETPTATEVPIPSRKSAAVEYARRFGWGSLFRRTPITKTDLQPIQQLASVPEGPPNTFRSTGNEPTFDFRQGFRAGWIRIDMRLRQWQAARGERCVAQLFADFGNGFAEPLETIVWSEILSEELFIRLPLRAAAIRLQPLQSVGDFTIEEFRIEPISRWGSLMQALRRKWQLLRTYRCTHRVIFRGLGMLLTGRFSTFKNKLFRGLPDSRFMRSEGNVNQESRSAASIALPIGGGPPSYAIKPRCRPLFVSANITGETAWDLLAIELIRGLRSLGVDVRLNPQSIHESAALPISLLGLRRQRQPGDTELVICPPALLAHHRPQTGFLWFTMLESDGLPELPRRINDCRCIIVPGRWNAETLRPLKIPVSQVPLGYDPLLFHPNGTRPTMCTFGTAGALRGGGIRKNIGKVIELFQMAFPHEADVRLRVKITPQCQLADVADPRVEILRTFLPTAELADWYRSLTAFVNGSFAEGFGLHLLEAMACGRPLISTHYSGVAEYFDGEVGYPVEHHIAPTQVEMYPGHWGVPDDGDLIRQMRAVYENQKRAAELGDNAACRARGFTWKETGRRLLEVLANEATPV